MFGKYILNSWEICLRCAKILLAAEDKMQLALIAFSLIIIGLNSAAILAKEIRAYFLTFPFI